MSRFGFEMTTVPTSTIRPLPRFAKITTLSLAAISFALSALMPMWLDLLIDAVTGPFDCANLIPKLEHAPSRFDQGSVCEANTRLWAAFYGVLMISVAGAVTLLAVNAGRLTLAVEPEWSVNSLVGIAIFLALGVGLTLFYLYGDLGGSRRRGGDLYDYRDVLVYADTQIFRLGLAASLFLAINIFFIAAIFIRRAGTEA